MALLQAVPTGDAPGRAKTVEGDKVRRRFDHAQTPYDRLVASGVLRPSQHSQLETLYQQTNPWQLRRDIYAG